MSAMRGRIKMPIAIQSTQAWNWQHTSPLDGPKGNHSSCSLSTHRAQVATAHFFRPRSKSEKARGKRSQSKACYWIRQFFSVETRERLWEQDTGLPLLQVKRRWTPICQEHRVCVCLFTQVLARRELGGGILANRAFHPRCDIRGKQSWVRSISFSYTSLAARFICKVSPASKNSISKWLAHITLRTEKTAEQNQSKQRFKVVSPFG